MRSNYLDPDVYPRLIASSWILRNMRAMLEAQLCRPPISLQKLNFSRSEGFSRTGYFLPARGSPGFSPDGEGSWDAAAAVAGAVVAVTWNFRSTFWLGNYIWSLSLWNWTQIRHLGTSVPGFCTEFRYLSYGQSGLAWGAIFEKSQKK